MSTNNMNKRYNTLNISRVNTCVCSDSTNNNASNTCVCSTTTTVTLPNVTVTRRLAVPSYKIWIIEEDCAWITFRASSLRNVFTRMANERMTHFRLIWNHGYVDPYKSFEYYDMPNEIFFVLEPVYRVEDCFGRPPSLSDEASSSDDSFGTSELQANRSFEAILTETSQYEPFFKVAEDICALCFQLKTSRTVNEASVAIGVFMRSLTGRSNLAFIKETIEKFVRDFSPIFGLQSDGHWINTITDVYDNYARCKDSALARKLKAFFNHMIMHCAYHKMGIEVDAELFDKIEKKKVRPTLSSCLTFVDAGIALISFLLKQGRQAMITGDLDHFFMDGDVLTVWSFKAKKLITNAEFLGNPAAVGINIHTYLAELAGAVNESKDLVKFMKPSTPEGRYFVGLQMDLTAVQKRYLTITAAQSLRKAPLGFIIYGNPGVGKSSVMGVISHFDALRRDRPIGSEFVYTFSAESEYYDNFKSSMHTIIIDDAAIHNPAQIQGVDPTVSDIMRIGNVIAWCPPQASLEDKGKTPMLVNLCLVSTNTADLNIPLYYAKSYAAMRRLMYRIEPVVRPEFAAPDGISLDPALAECPTVYDDYWSFVVYKATLKSEMKGAYEYHKKFPSMSSLLQWLGALSDKHDAEQERFLARNQNFSITLCDGCKNPSDMCLCDTEELQNAFNEIPGVVSVEGSNFYSFDEDVDPLLEQIRSTRTTFHDKFLGEDGKYYLFDDNPTKCKQWRVECERIGARRTYTAAMSEKFMEKMVGTCEPMCLSYYAYEELPVLLNEGWPDFHILDDYAAFTVYCTEKEGVDNVMEMAAMFVDTQIHAQNGTKPGGILDGIFKFFVSLYFYSAYFRGTLRYFGQYNFIRRMAMRFIKPRLQKTENQKHLMRSLGRKIDESLGGSNVWVRTAIGLVSAGTVAAMVYAVWSKFTPKDQPKGLGGFWRDPDVETLVNGSTRSLVDPDEVAGLEEFDDIPVEVGVPVDDKLQVLRDFGSIPKKAPGDEHMNPWLAKDRAITTEDFVPDLCRDLIGLKRKLCKNVLLFDVSQPVAGGAWKFSGNLIVLSNEHFVTNSHSIPTEGVCRMTVYYNRNHKMQGVSPKVEFEITQSMIERVPERDIAIVRTRNLPALSVDISKNFVRDSYDGVFDGFYLIKREDGSVKMIDVLNIRKIHVNRVVEGFTFSMPAFRGTVTEATQLGDCGAPLIVNSGYGPVIVGYHAMYDSELSCVTATKFSYEDFKHYATEMEVQCGKLPIGSLKLVPAARSYIDYHQTGIMMYHGELEGFRCRPKHHVQDTELASQIYGQTLNGVVVERRLCGPVMDSWRAQQTGLKEFLQPVPHMEESILEEIADVWVEHILSMLPKSELDLICPCNIDVAVNGVPGMAYVDSIKRSTSMGFPYYKTKKAYLEELEDDRWPEGVKFKDPIEEKIAEWLDLLRQGIRLHAIFGANLKDEPVSFKKFDACKTRIFFSCPAELLVIVRMFYLSFSRVVQRNRDLFWVAVGLNTTSPEWDGLFHRLSKFGVDTAIAGDHVYFDKRVKMLVMFYVMDAVNRICLASGHYTPEMQLMMKVLKYELMNPSVDFFGMLVTFFGGEVSGHQLTTIFNCILNVFYVMYCWAKAGYDLKEFFAHVVGVLLGDDHVLCVCPSKPLYTHTHIKNILEGLGLGYTMADKESVSRPYINLYEASFLKRNFCYDMELGLHVGQLEFNSILKMLTIQVASRKVMCSTQLAQALCSATNEMFFYGRGPFEELVSFIDSLEKSASLKEQMLGFPILSYDAYKRRFWGCQQPQAYVTGLQSQKSLQCDSYCPKFNQALNCGGRVGHTVFHARAFPEIRVYGSVEHDTEKSLKADRHKAVCWHGNLNLSKTNEQMNAIQSEIPATEGSESSTSQQTQFVNESPPEMLALGVPHDPTAQSLVTNAYLADFLSRPTKISTFTWTENAAAGIQTTLNPWELFFNVSSIKNKLEGFGFIRCKLHVKFTINASQFYYGSIGAFYTPLHTMLKETTGVGFGYAAGAQLLQSQKPHVWLDPQTTSTAVLELPFLYNRHFINTCLTGNMGAMGKIDLIQFAALRSANGVTTAGVNIVMYAWATDVELSGLTSKAVLQAKKEYTGNGQISGPASTVASVANALKKVPIIAPFASATETAANMVGGIASFFGFTNVPNVKDVEPMKSLAFHTLASSEISEPINKLSLQPKQEIAMDDTYAGDPYADQLLISNFCQRESFLCGALWTTSNAEDVIVFSSFVTPQLYEKSSGTNYAIYDTPMSYMSRLFKQWRGDLIFRIKVVKTQYHRGRLSVAWDPLMYNIANMPSYGNPRVQNIIFDLDETDTIEIKVPYMQETPFLQLKDGATTYGGPYWSNGPSPTGTVSLGQMNGVLQVRVVNRLTAPEASSDVDVLIFVRAADNIEFAGPNEIRDKTFLTLQSKKEFIMGPPSYSDPQSYKEVFGEKIGSVRELLHRQSKVFTQVIPKNADWAGAQMTFVIPFQRTPRVYGYQSAGPESAKGILIPANDFGFNFVRTSPLSWMQYCFIGTKGSTNWTFNVVNNDGKSARTTHSMAVCRVPEPSTRAPYAYSVASTNSTSQLMRNYNTATTADRQGAQGMALTNQHTQAGLSVNLPYYSRFKFLINNADYQLNLDNANKEDDSAIDWFEFSLKRGVTAGTADADVLVDVFVGTGPDFDLVFFLNCPYYIYLPPPTATTTG